jgi:ADP-heptose:LPS heptosyltransferase
MTFRQRIALDRLLAVPLCFLCDWLARLAGAVLRRDHTITHTNTRRLVVCKLVGMGSIIQATPLLRALKKNFPDAHLTFVTLAANRPLVERLDYVDEILCLDDSGALKMAWTTITTLQQLIRQRVDHYFDLEVYSGFTCLLSVFSLARNRLGFYRHTSRYKRGIYTHLVYFNTRMAVRRLYLQLGCVVGAAATDAPELGSLRIDPADRIALAQKLSALGLLTGERFVLVNPNASDLLIERRWPQAHLVTALTQLASAGCSLVLMGARSERTYVADIIERAACVLTNDTGPMHMAFALNRPTVCLFGPVDPAHYGIENPNVIILYAPVPCSPCVHEIDEPPCHGHNVCMQRLLPELAVARVLTLLGGQPVTAPSRLPLIWRGSNQRPLGIILRHSIPEPSLA